MKIFATLALTVLVALLPQLQGKPMDYAEEQAIAELLKSFLQEETMIQEMSVTDLAVEQQDEFSLEVVDCDEITKEIQGSLSAYLGKLVSRKVTLTCSGSGPVTTGTGTGVTYTRWGHNECPAQPGTELLYAGVMAGVFYNKKGGGANFLCLPDNPDDGDLKTAFPHDHSRIYGTEYEYPIVGTHNHGVPCAICYASTRSAQLMIPAKTKCPAGWTREYYGYIMSEGDWPDRSRSEYICVDKEQVSLPSSTHAENIDGAVIYHVRAVCRGIQCPPYNAKKALTCTVCSK